MFRLEWLGLAVLVGLTVSMREPLRSAAETAGERATDAHIIACPIRSAARQAEIARMMEQDRRTMVALADFQYRNGESTRAAVTIRDIPDVLWETDLQSLVQLYASFAEESATIASPNTTTVDLFVALRRAQALDMALGGAFADRLNDLMRTIAPEAAAAYTRLHDRIGADLAKHTAELFR